MKTTKKYAPVWVLVFSAGTTLLRMVGQRLIVREEWELSWKDLRSALTGAIVGYAAFRMRHGNKEKGVLTR